MALKINFHAIAFTFYRSFFCLQKNGVAHFALGLRSLCSRSSGSALRRLPLEIFCTKINMLFSAADNGRRQLIRSGTFAAKKWDCSLL
jgi:hypothetical protein